ncbi:hypothetical protein [Methylomonas albis]|nr:hypothetical protein [Methylomonas albis]
MLFAWNRIEFVAFQPLSTGGIASRHAVKFAPVLIFKET